MHENLKWSDKGFPRKTTGGRSIEEDVKGESRGISMAEGRRKHAMRLLGPRSLERLDGNLSRRINCEVIVLMKNHSTCVGTY